MVDAVSGVSSVPVKIGALDKVDSNVLSQPGAYALVPMVPTGAPEKKKKGGLISSLAKLIITAGLITGAAVGARKLVPALKEISTAGELAQGATNVEKVKYYFAKYTDKIIDVATKKIPEMLKKAPIEEKPLDTVA